MSATGEPDFRADMSGIFGLIQLDDSPVRAEDLRLMRAAMQEWGPDAGALWVQAQAGLGSLVRFDTPESLGEKLPAESNQGFVLTAEARLDNRPELALELGISAAELPSTPDGAFVLRAYEKWRSSAPNHLLGDWSFAALAPALNGCSTWRAITLATRPSTISRMSGALRSPHRGMLSSPSESPGG